MKTLILMRHAKAENADGLQTDFDRNLNEKGIKDAAEMGHRLEAKKINPDLIICSASKRTLQTAKIVAKQLVYNEHNIQKEFELYNCAVDEAISIISNISNDYKTVLLIGHNPAITSLAGCLTNNYVEVLPTAGQACIQFKGFLWKQVAQNFGELKWVDEPKLPSY
jgi:phosphohistidine phosphatase